MLIVLKKCTCFKENYFSLKLFGIFSFKIESITLDPDPNSMYLDPLRCVQDAVTVHHAASQDARSDIVWFSVT